MTTTKSPVHLKPGEIAQHPDKGRGVVVATQYGRAAVKYAHPLDGGACQADNIAGWERVETVRPGHVQVRVDDLDLSEWAALGEHPEQSPSGTVAVRAAKALAAQQAESMPPADEQPAPDEQLPDTVTVKLRCPHGCGDTVEGTVGVVSYDSDDEAWIQLVATPHHRCKPTQPDEPGLGSVVTVDGTHYVRIERDAETEPYHWLRVGSTGTTCTTWDELTGRGAVTIGWGDGGQP